MLGMEYDNELRTDKTVDKYLVAFFFLIVHLGLRLVGFLLIIVRTGSLHQFRNITVRPWQRNISNEYMREIQRID